MHLHFIARHQPPPISFAYVHRCTVASEHEPCRFSFRPSRSGRGLGAEMFADVPESDEVSGAFELRSEIKAAMKQVADCLAALEPKKAT